MARDALDFRNLVARKQQRAPLGGKAHHARQEFAPDEEIQPGCRLVEQQHFGFERQRQRQADLRVLAFRESFQLLFAIELERFEPFFIALEIPGAWKPAVNQPSSRALSLS